MDVTHPCRVKTQPGMMIKKKEKKEKKSRHQGKRSGKKQRAGRMTRGVHSPNGTTQLSMYRYCQERWFVKKQGEEQYVLYPYFCKINRPVD